MTAERPQAEDSDRVVWLRRPGTVPGYTRPGRYSGASQETPVGDLAPYEGSGEEPEDYRHRMWVNLLAFAFCAFLIVAGVWLFTKIADMRKDQDCVLSGRRGCTPVDVTPQSRW